ncbi:MAG TPA: UDP-2,3-diacylglucosamine diphosphatase [Bacteroidales bacterium]|nr:UDP-2,3-diacylglucosamine diphosphatase [Bacteroidales bacterium]
MKEKKRKVDLVVISDVHLGTYGCRADRLHDYLQHIKPKILVLNGDIVDVWQFSKRYWPKAHMKVIKDVISMAAKGTQVYYITGNHDEILRKFAGLKLGSIEITNKLELILDGNKTWFFHGDVFDVLMQNSRWIEKAGAIGYDFLILVNVMVNFFTRLFGKKRVSISKKIKENVKTAVKYISRFEITAARLALKNGFHAIVCGHIHQPEIRQISLDNCSIVYMNSGDWIENLTSLEYNEGEWCVHRHPDETQKNTLLIEEDVDESLVEMDNKEVFKMVMKEFQIQS